MATGNPTPRHKHRFDAALATLFAGMTGRRHITSLLAVLFALCLLPTGALADCFLSSAGSTITFSAPSTITLPSNLQAGTQTILWTSSAVTPSTPPQLFLCDGTSQSGLYDYGNASGTPIGSNLFPTNIPNLYFRITYNGTPLPTVPPGYTLPSPGFFSTLTLNQPSVLTLVATGPIANGATLSGQIAQWQLGNSLPSSNVLQPYAISAVTLKAPACSVAIDPTVVTLPPVSATAFTGTNSTAGPTPFNVQLNCQSGSNLSITLATNSPQSGTTSVIAPTTGNGNAGNVGVQVLNGSSCTTPITFGTAISEGATPNGAMNLPFCARYYQTAPNVTAGTVSATATYTLTYQ